MIFYHAAIRLAALLGNAKARAWVDGRRHWLSKLDRFRTQRSEVPLIWMHCSSLGEFEQGQPTLEYVRQAHPRHLIALTFFSPSGYEKRRHYAGADWVGYLPADTPANARNWVATLRPSLAIFVKYEFWYYHLRELDRQGVALALIAGSFRPGQIFFRPYGFFFRRLLRRFDLLTVQTARDQELLDDLHLPGKVTVAGDPRTDRTLAIAGEAFSDARIAAFAAAHNLIIAGSTWPADEQILSTWLPHLPTGWKLLIAPHELSPAHLEQLDALLPSDTIRYSDAPNPAALSAARVLVLDTIGLLKKIYRYGRIAYIGGGFGTSIHNTLEPMAYRLPVIFGPKHDKFPEAVAAVHSGAAFVVTDTASLRSTLRDLADTEHYGAARQAVNQLISAAAGAADRTNAAIEMLLPAE